MFRLIRLIVMIWLLSSLAVLIPLHTGDAHPCDIPIVRTLGRQTYSEQITDYHTGIALNQELNYHTVDLSPDEQYRYRVAYEEADTEALYLAPVHSESWELLYSTALHMQPYWSLDGESLFIYEYHSISGTFFGRRLLGIQIASGEITFEYDFSSTTSASLSGRSPDNRYLYIRDGERRASVDTVTGEITFFTQRVPQDYQIWSSDRNWVIRGSVNQIFVVHPQTGDFHPQLTAAIDGRYPQWTTQSIWFTRSENEVYSVWSASLIDGSIQREYLNLSLRFVSPDDRWRVLVSPDDETESVSYIYDRDSEMRVTENNISWVDFSANGQCMLIVKLDNLNPTGSELLVYELETMHVFARYNLGLRRTFRFFFGYHWYDEQYFDSVEGLYTLLD